ncbi:uncharacterized protein LOC108049975 [Drosophila rhopaloa]|uniref:Uncharacterized protein LOC108049975 n=1 Tax=Drosophila rhopaloa TaxID=1041015 RepID=A0A6P4F9L5_DRORH|nr:uncharacterized protein LOC108049975 [Drosophila rhopaloa]
MLKYLAGIFVKPRNDYVDGRLTTPLTKKMRTSCVPQARKSSQVKISLISAKSIIKGKGKSENREPRRRREGNPQVSQPISRSSMESPKFQLEDPISYIVNVAASSSSNETIPLLPGEVLRNDQKPLEDRDQNRVYRTNKKESRCPGGLLGQSLPVPPPVTRVQSWMSCATAPLDANPFNELDDLSISKPISIGGDQDPIGWEMGLLAEDFWSADSDPEAK